jgi:ribosomal protein S27E
MKYIISSLRLRSGRSILFIFSTLSLIILANIQISCPVCGSIVVNETGSELTNFRILEVNADLTDYKITYPGCGYSYSLCTYELSIVAINDGSELLSVPALIHGVLPQEAILAHPTWVERNAKLTHIDILGGEEKHIQETVQLWVDGLDVSRAVTSQVQFSIITDASKIKANCPVCGGKEKVSFNQWLMVIVK